MKPKHPPIVHIGMMGMGDPGIHPLKPVTYEDSACRSIVLPPMPPIVICEMTPGKGPRELSRFAHYVFETVEDYQEHLRLKSVIIPWCYEI